MLKQQYVTAGELAERLGVAPSIGNPSTYYRTQAGKTLVDKYGAKDC
jgi:hypothetical protein